VYIITKEKARGKGRFFSKKLYAGKRREGGLEQAFCAVLKQIESICADKC
jgi:hypothetical protein